LPLIVFFMPTHVGVFLLFLMIMTVTSVFNHLGYELYPLAFVRIRLLRSVITATHHQMHHRLVHCNYGLYFTWWDMIMKTHHKGYPEFFEEIYSRRPTEKNVQILGNRVIEPAPTSPASG
jgi:sterol desaturase/sphingolipid hydroxylase (fatty acid hydroxylase superfamily)